MQLVEIFYLLSTCISETGCHPSNQWSVSSGDIQNPPGCSPVQPVVGEPASAVGLD